MLRLLMFGTLLAGLFALPVSAQPLDSRTFEFSATGSSNAIDQISNGVNLHKIVWRASTNPSTCTVKIESSVDGETWADLLAAQTCTTPGISAITSGVANYVRYAGYVDIAAATDGSGSEDEVAFFNAAGLLAGDANFTYDGSDLALASDSNANAFLMDGGQLNGSGVFSFGTATTAAASVKMSVAPGTLGATLNYARLLVEAGGAVSTAGTGTHPSIATAQFYEPNITGSNVTTASTVLINNPPTEATNNFALYINEGTLATNDDIQVLDGSYGIVHDIQDTGEVVFNEPASDIDFRVEADSEDYGFVLNAGYFGGNGAVSFGSNVTTAASAKFGSVPGTLSVAGGNYYRLLVEADGVVTSAGSGTHGVIASLNVGEPLITIGTAAVTNASTIRVAGAPTEGTNNFALYAHAGTIATNDDIQVLNGSYGIVHDIQDTGEVVFNELGSDIDYRIESDSNANAFRVDGNLLNGSGVVSFGVPPSAAGQVRIASIPGTLTSGANYTILLVESEGVIGRPVSGTHTNISTASFGIPNIAGSGATVTNAATVRILGAPTEATTNTALEIVSGSVKIGMDDNLTEAGAVCITSGDLLSDESDGVCDSSSRSVKENIRTSPYGLEAILAMDPVIFRYKEEHNPDFRLYRVGFIAEEMDEVVPEVVTYDRSGAPDGIDYGKLTAVLVSGLQELTIRVEQLESELALSRQLVAN